jgi:TetR/AcrR family transcriptional regulator, transcriptional repressor for nem operon
MTPIVSDTRERLVEAARDLFLMQGYQATGIAQILKRAGANSGSLYNFFPTKEDLLIAVLEWYRDHIQDDLLDLHTARIDDPLERIFGLLDGYRKMLISCNFEVGCPIGNLALEVSNTHPAVRSLLLVNFDQWVDAVEGFLTAAADRLPEDLDRRTLAVHILTTMEGGVMLARTYRSISRFDQTVTHLRAYIEGLVREGTQWSAPKPGPVTERPQ